MNRQDLHFSVSIKTPQGERALRVKARDSLTATKIGIRRLNIRDHEIPPAGLDLKVRATA